MLLSSAPLYLHTEGKDSLTMVPLVQSLIVVSSTQVKNNLSHRHRYHWVSTSVQDSVWRLLAKETMAVNATSSLDC